MSDQTARTPERRTGWSVSRRRALQLGGGLADAAMAAPSAAGPRSRAATITEGTNTMVAVSPDGRRLAFDLVTAIWVLNAHGGTARRLTDDLQDASRPRWSPDGRLIAFQSYADGNYHLWTIRLDGTGLRQHTSGRYDHREPCFTPDGAALVFSSDRGGDSYGVFRLDLATGTVTALTDTAVEEAEPVVAGNRLAFTVDAASIDEVDLATGARRTVVPAQQGSSVYGPAARSRTRGWPGRGAISWSTARRSPAARTCSRCHRAGRRRPSCSTPRTVTSSGTRSAAATG